MKPRLSTSKKWTGLPKEYQTQMEAVVQEAFKQQLGLARVHVEGRIYPDEVQLRVGFIESGRLRQQNFEVSLNSSREKLDADEKLSECLDIAASLMTDFFESEGELELPGEWTQIEFDKQLVYIQSSTVNTSLEAEADRLLQLSQEKMVFELEETDDALEHAELLNIDYSKLNADQALLAPNPGREPASKPSPKKPIH